VSVRGKTLRHNEEKTATISKRHDNLDVQIELRSDIVIPCGMS
jgi:hypothetical protein